MSDRPRHPLPFVIWCIVWLTAVMMGIGAFIGWSRENAGEWHVPLMGATIAGFIFIGWICDQLTAPRAGADRAEPKAAPAAAAEPRQQPRSHPRLPSGV
jgi:hypothetical protein